MNPRCEIRPAAELRLNAADFADDAAWLGADEAHPCDAAMAEDHAEDRDEVQMSLLAWAISARLGVI